MNVCAMVPFLRKGDNAKTIETTVPDFWVSSFFMIDFQFCCVLWNQMGKDVCVC